ncbi:MAG: LamG-like jellyroll fold domain-containing protein [Desulfobacterales bacterium]
MIIIDIPYTAEIEPSVFTISLWLKTSQATQSVLMSSDPDGYKCLHGYNIYSDPDGAIFNVDPSSSCGTGNNVYGEAREVNDGKWHHIVAICDSAPYLYVDSSYEGRG